MKMKDQIVVNMLRLFEVSEDKFGAIVNWAVVKFIRSNNPATIK
jgi:hypothetical protein